MSPRASILAGLFITLTLGSDAVAQDNPLVVLETSLGDITIELFKGQGSDLRGELPHLCQRRLLRRHGVSSSDSNVHDPRWRDDG